MAFAASMTDPPPTARIISTPSVFANSMPSRTSNNRGLGDIPAYSTHEIACTSKSSTISSNIPYSFTADFPVRMSTEVP